MTRKIVIDCQIRTFVSLMKKWMNKWVGEWVSEWSIFAYLNLCVVLIRTANLSRLSNSKYKKKNSNSFFCCCSLCGCIEVVYTSIFPRPNSIYFLIISLSNNFQSCLCHAIHITSIIQFKPTTSRGCEVLKWDDYK